ncbi:MAG: hypothetical protein NVSMB44_34760 [Ktedonobacteraceae bacterium]
MPVDPQLQVLLNQIASLNMPPMSSLPVEVVRQSIEQMNTSDPNPPPVQSAVDRTIPGPAGEIPIRIYTPTGQGPFPVLAFFHGGGFVIGTIEAYDSICRMLTNMTPCITVSVGYHLAPEHPYPAAPEDCYAATKWVVEHAAEFHGDPARVAVGGDSAGGNLATVVALMAKERGGPELAFQLLIYPTTDNHQPGTASLTENANGYFLTKDLIDWFDKHYISPSVDRKDPRAFPLYANDLRNLPPALIITAEYDPLRDEGEMYAKRLQDADVPVTLTRYDGMIHGFFTMTGIVDQSKIAVLEAVSALRKAFA